ncbi:MAG: 16S rRNA (cytosine(1402)-N(4))-methyltransferase RsmH [Myxococcota bacterium]|nr:16S rRNA (cytosine(1402)-N(4))-methyltransferase RsmH [Myxococcota bacterium]
MTQDFQHCPVLESETLELLHLKPGATIVDGTLGGGGHAEAILERTAPDGRLIGIDLDSEARGAARTRLARFGERLQVVPGSFRDLDDIVEQLGMGPVDGVLLDLGVSSHQLDASERGFRFALESAEDTPLDMRMDPGVGKPASDLLRSASARELQLWFQEYGELPGSKRLARAIVETRKQDPIRTTADLTRVIEQAGIGRGRKHNPATLVFQALRIAVNDELTALRCGLDAAIRVLRPGGRLVVIAYHSLEDRIVKQTLRDAAKGCTCPPRTPVCICGGEITLRVITRRPIQPSEEEVRRNPRARSGRLRAAERVSAADDSRPRRTIGAAA